jgi:hypothetical protein
LYAFIYSFVYNGILPAFQLFFKEKFFYSLPDLEASVLLRIGIDDVLAVHFEGRSVGSGRKAFRFSNNHWSLAFSIKAMNYT